MSPNEEVELLKKARSGDDRAREELYVKFFSENKQVRALLSREVREPGTREDILHDAYISLLRSQAEFRGDSRLSTFIYRVVQIAILQFRRSQKSDREDKMVRLSFEFEGEEKRRELAVQDYQFEQVEAGKMADKLYGLLPEPLRTAFRLRVSEELSYEEIAERTGAPVNTVATRIFKARNHLAKLFGASAVSGDTDSALAARAKKKLTR